MGYYPVFLDLKARPCLVIGSGPEAERKSEGLIEVGAAVTVVAPQPSPRLQELATRGKIVLHRRHYAQGDLAGVFLAIVATDVKPEVREGVAADARREKVLLNVMDVPDLCTWIAPAILRRGTLAVAISTSGRSPAMARLVKERLDLSIPEEYGPLLDTVAEVREELARRGLRVPAEDWQIALDQEINNLAAERDWRKIKARLLRSLAPQAETPTKEFSPSARG